MFKSHYHAHADFVDVYNRNGTPRTAPHRTLSLQWLLTGLNAHPIEGLMYLAPAGSVWLALGAACLELPKVWLRACVCV